MSETTKATMEQIERQIAELAPLQIIRTETVLSKLPIHNLAKKGTISINITQRNEKGEVALHWEVSPNPKYGDPRQLAYKLDTLVINRMIEEAGKPVPKQIRLGSLREIAAALDLGASGDAMKRIKNALYQNAFTAITAKLNYVGHDGAEKNLEAAFTRYSLVFAGSKLPDGKKADAAYLILNEPYREVLNNAPFRPLDYDYLRKLPPAPQRFYELVSRRMFAALKYQHAEAKLAYSEYCTCSAQQRYYDYDRFKKQMYKIHRPHLASGYLKEVHYEATKDEQGRPDWMMFYKPGPKARAEYQAFTKSGRTIDSEMEQGDVEIHPAPSKRSAGQRQKTLPLLPDEQQPATHAGEITAAMVQRGIAPAKAAELALTAEAYLLLDQLEWGDEQIRRAGPGEIRNPAGFYIYLIENKILPGPEFETTRSKRARREAERESEQQRQQRVELEIAYTGYRSVEVERHVSAAPAAEFASRVGRHKTATEQKYPHLPSATVMEIATREARNELAAERGVLTFEQYCRARQSEGRS